VPVEKASEIYEGGKKIGEVWLCLTLGWKDTAAELRWDAIGIRDREWGWFDLRVDTKHVPKLEAILKLYGLRADSFTAYIPHGFPYRGVVGYLLLQTIRGETRLHQS